MILKVFSILLLALLSGFLYRAGGKGKPFNTKWRDLGVPTITMVSFYLMTNSLTWWAYLLSFGLLFGALTTYWDFLTKLWRGNEDEHWENWLFSGLSYGLSFLPFAIASGHYLGFWLRVIVLGISTMIWSERVGEDWLEEMGRGALIILTIPLLLI